jgi:tetratricopeptide (TPR) repeat protein
MSPLRHRTLAPLAGVLLLCAAFPAVAAGEVPRGPSREPVPFRYDSAAYKDVPRAFLTDGPACVLYCGTSYVLEPGGAVEQIVHQVTRLNNRRGVELLGEFRSIAYDPSFQKLTLHLARIHKPDGQAIDVGPPHTHLRDTNTDHAVYDHHKQLIISFPGLAAGDVIEVKWGLRGRDPEEHGHLFNSYPFGDDDHPTVHEELRVLLPRGRVLYQNTRGGKLEPTVTDTPDGRLYHWQVRLRPPLAADTDVPTKEELRLKVFYSTYATWDEVGDWYRRVTKGCWECPPEAERIAREVTRGLTSDADRARALTYWVRKNVRYLSLHERESWQPHTPERVLAIRYGDCHDQSRLLAALLRAAGVPAAVAMISWPDHGEIRASFPSAWGPHAIVRARVAGADRWIDPVFSHAAWDVLPPEDCDRVCFVIDETGPVRLLRTPKLSPQANRTEQTTWVRIARDGSARGRRDIAYAGVAAAYQRSQLQSLPQVGRKAHLLAELQQLHPGVKVTQVTIDPHTLENLDEPVRVGVEFELPREFAASTMGLLDAEVYSHLLAHRAAADRKVPLGLGEPCELSHHFILDADVGYRLTAGEADKTADSAWGSFRRTVRTTERADRVDMESHLVLSNARVEPSELLTFARFHGAVQDAYNLWVTRAETTELADAALLEAELARSPRDAELALLLARLYRSGSKPADALRVLHAAMEQAPDDRLARAVLEVAAEQEKAVKAVRARAHLQLARTALAQQKYAEVLNELTTAGTDDAELLLSAEALALRGEACAALGKSRDAVQAFESILSRDANDLRALPALAVLAIAAKDRPKALTHLRRYTVLVGDAAGLAAAADLHLRLDRLDDALDLATRSNQMSASAAARRVQGLVHLRRLEYAEAVTDLGAALELAADKTRPDAAVLEGLIRARLALGDLAEAEALARTAGRVAGAPPALKVMCETVAVLGRRRDALLREIQPPADRAAACASSAGRTACAEQAYARGRPAGEVGALVSAALGGGLEIAPALALRGLLALERGRLSDALADAERAVALSPRAARGYYVRGRVRLERGDAQALADLEKAAALGGRQDAAVLHWLAAALYQAGRGKDAVATQREALQRRPGEREFAAQLRRFEAPRR